ncbi:diacylglycerol kinase family lipid kinase [Gelidibacter salicanalis]|uniref:Diacylglycerol kinase family lipid kinase n=1 Tax=Gelidibacter salicanalis TaxID=291193 RepID=A0A5C7AHD4_9FLAO|nr:diacylglycerol kinase family protein [Gelidibacter salicanalis]TXE07811.1 diacylglycerol kinase family lipid kinase [Gelidibacter salicanalis]
MLNIHFIVNPIAGSGKHRLSETLLQHYFEPQNYLITLKTSEYKSHASELTKASIQQHADIIVACGGDGTVNEVASLLVGTTIPLGIVPIGSGNGLANNLKIPTHLAEALEIIKKNQPTMIDVGCVNQRYFFSNIGFGFTAKVIEHYAASEKRTWRCYLKACYKAFWAYYKKETVVMVIDDNIELRNPFLFFISNSNVMGYTMSLTPKASLKDGLLDVLIVPNISRLKMMYLGVLLLLKKPHALKEVRYYQTTALNITQKGAPIFSAQIDGEWSQTEAKSTLVALKEKALNVLV